MHRARVDRPWRPAREELERHHAPRELIGAPVERLAAELLRRHVRDGPEDRARARERVGVERRGAGLDAARDPEVEHLHGAVEPDHHVLGFHVPVDEAAIVRRSERAGDVGQPAYAAFDRHGVVTDVGAEASAPR